MDYQKYSKSAFQVCGLNSEVARRLSDQLQDDVRTELDAVLLPAFEKIVAALNAHGHNLRPYGQIRPGDVSYWDQTTHDDCRLRLAYDLVISAGYAHTVSPEEADAQLSKDTSEGGT